MSLKQRTYCVWYDMAVTMERDLIIIVILMCNSILQSTVYEFGVRKTKWKKKKNQFCIRTHINAA
jgi:hypothetical protein